MKRLPILSNLIPDEHILREGEGYVLTTVRLRSANNRFVKSVMLSEVTSCRIEYVEHPFWVLLAVLLAMAGMVLSNETHSGAPAFIAIAMAVVMIFAFFQTRSGLVRVASPTLYIDITFTSTDSEEMLALVDLVEQAKWLPN